MYANVGKLDELCYATFLYQVSEVKQVLKAHETFAKHHYIKQNV